MKKECLNDKVLQEDIEYVVKHNKLLSVLNDCTVLVTGATGLIGSQLVKLLCCYNRLETGNITIIALVRNKEKALCIYKDILERSNFHIVVNDILEEIDIKENIDYIVHCASETSSESFVNYPVETIHTAITGTKNILDLAREKRIKSLVYLSSLEVYGVPTHKRVRETDYGFIDFLNVRSSYSESKRLAECMCTSYLKEYGVPIKIARLSQTFGAGVDYADKRVFAQFARSIIEKSDIILHTDGSTIRNYCYTGDALNALLFILVKGKEGEAYNVANPNSLISIKDMAELLIGMYPGAGIKLIIEQPTGNMGYNPKVEIELDTTKLEQIGWKPVTSLQNMYRRMIMSLSSRKKSMEESI